MYASFVFLTNSLFEILATVLQITHLCTLFVCFCIVFIIFMLTFPQCEAKETDDELRASLQVIVGINTIFYSPNNGYTCYRTSKSSKSSSIVNY